jgi:nucleoside-diphosphate-sugar epimerase
MQSAWERLRGKRVFITGGTGFIGCWLLEAFLWASNTFHLGASVVVLTRDPEGFSRRVPHLASERSVELLQGDARTFAFPSGSFSHVIHAGGPGRESLACETPLETFSAIVDGSRRVLDFALRCHAESVLFVSSGAVYGRNVQQAEHLSENHFGALDPSDPLSAYAEGKRAAEFLCAAYRHDYALDVKIARCFTFAGRYLNPAAGFAITDFVLDALRGGPVVVRGDGTALRSYLHGADLAAWLWTILLRGLPGRTYNVGSEQSISIGELAHAIAGMCEPQPDVRVCTAATPGLRAECYVPSTKRAQEELGLRQTVRLADALRDTLGWLRQMQTTASANEQESEQSSPNDGRVGGLDPEASRARTPSTGASKTQTIRRGQE